MPLSQVLYPINQPDEPVILTLGIKKEKMSWFSNIFGGEKGVLGHKDTTTVEIHGRPLRCLVCGHRYFWRHEALVDTRTLTFFNVEWMNKTATCAVCDHCGYIHWFIPPPLKEESSEQ